MFVQSSLPLKKEGEKKGIPKVHSLFLEEERILGEIKKKWWSQPDRERGSLMTDQKADRGIRESRELWQEKERQGEKEREREQDT